ncbi:MAG: serine hydrolase [Phycisphaeraceae bacterium]|nr:serine hydrolase [Phycisphaeraceae bacterium]MCW5754895.1 serine hydrolase [Phycisphaeraceae bacterium]
MIRVFLATVLLAGGWAFAQGPEETASETRAADAFDPLRIWLSRAAVEGRTAGGSMGLWNEQGRVFAHGFGYADIEHSREFAINELCHIASMTKPITATVIVMLADRGTLSLDEPVSRWLTEFKEVRLVGGEPVAAPTLRQLLSHTGGAPGNIERDQLFREGVVRRGESLEENVRALAARGLSHAPGSRFAYSGYGYVIAARAAEAAAGVAWDTLCREVLFDPLGMRDTTYRPDEDAVRSSARPYRRNRAGAWEAAPRINPPREGQYLNAGGGLYSTLEDLGRFYQLHLHGGEYHGTRLVSAEAIRAMYVPQPNSPRYGLGFQLAGPIVGGRASVVYHGGATGTLGWVDFEHQTAGVVLTQVPGSRALLADARVEAAKMLGYAPTPVGEDLDEEAAPRRRGQTMAEAFAEMDKDGDGRISREEWTRDPRGFDILDANKDGYLTLEEIEAVSGRLGGS